MEPRPSAPALPDQMLRRRSELRLSERKAARLAGVSRTSWAKWEKGRAVPVSRKSQGAIEEALQWAPGSVAAILAGGEPIPLEVPPEPDYTDPLTGETYTGVEAQLWDLRHDLGQRWVDEYGEERATELGAERAREHIRLHRLQRDMNPVPARVA